MDKKYSGLIVALLMILALNTTMTFTMTTTHSGWNEEFIYRFTNGWVIGFTVAFPTSILVIPFARRLTAKLAE